MYQPEVLVDTFQCLELNELEKSLYVSSVWKNVIRRYQSTILQQKRRVYVLRITDVGSC